MVDVRGAAVPGYATTGPPDLPRPKKGPRPSHRPWCCDCKNTVNSGKDLDRDGRCATCGHLAVRRAEAAARRGHETPAPAGPTRTNRKLDDTQRAAIASRYRAGESGTALARDYGVTANAIYTALRKAGVTPRPRNAPAAGTTTNEEPLS